MTAQDLPDPSRFWSRTQEVNGCWNWTGSKTSAGYGNLRLPNGKYDYAHRVAYRLANGVIPTGLVLDHLCRQRHCVNPAHLEPVTQRENVRRGAAGYGAIRTECRQGHDITKPENVYTNPAGERRCRVCAKAIDASRKAERHARGDLRKILRPTCRHGHAYDEVNTHIGKGGRRRCRACSRAAAARQREKRKHDSV